MSDTSSTTQAHSALRCPDHGDTPRFYEDEGHLYCTELLPDAGDTGDICGKQLQGETPAEPMRYVIDVDWSSWHCPCGETLRGQSCERLGLDYKAWRREHAPHTNGMEHQSATGAAQRVMAFESRTVPIEAEQN